MNFYGAVCTDGALRLKHPRATSESVADPVSATLFHQISHASHAVVSNAWYILRKIQKSR